MNLNVMSLILLNISETQLANGYIQQNPPLRPQFPSPKVFFQQLQCRERNKVSSLAFDYRRQSITAQYLCSQFILY